jgi:hypothetical protein
MDPIIGAAAIQSGGNLLGSLAGWLGGSGELDRLMKNYSRSRNLLMSDLGDDIFDPEYALALSDVAQIPQMRSAGGQIAKASGNINAADATGALWEKLLGTRAQNYNQLFLANAEGKARRDQMIKNMLFSADAQALANF